MTDKQIQKGGEGTQLQAGGDIVIHAGLTVDAAREVFEANAVLLRQELTAHADGLVTERLNDLEARLLSRFSVPELLPAFADPDFQFNVLEAQRGAARSGDPDDLDLIVDLLAQRAETPPTPRLRMSTRRALDLVGQIAPEAVNGLTAYWYASSLSPTVPYFDKHLDRMEAALGPFIDAGLPEDQKWQVDVLLLGCFHVVPDAFGGIRPFHEFFADKCGGFACRGFDEAEAAQARQQLASVDHGLAGLVVQHPLDPERFTLLGRNEAHLRSIVEEMLSTRPRDEWEPVFDQVVEANGYGTPLDGAVDRLKEHIDARPTLATFQGWWNLLRPYEITPPGVVLAYSNFRRLNQGSGLPALATLL